MNRKLVCGPRLLDISKPAIMGILNVTPDSFSDGGVYNQRDLALRRVEKMVADGADIVDVGGESTRPGAKPVSALEEINRVVPIVEAIGQRIDVTISVDTSTPDVIRESSLAGAHLINDVRALEKDGALQSVVASGLPVCLMHMKGIPETMQDQPEYESVTDDVLGYLSSRMKVCEAAGIKRDQILVDPGFGFGKTYGHNYELLSHFERFQELGVPILAGLSRKRMIGEATRVQDANKRLCGSLSGAVICAIKGASILRVHDVRETAEALSVVKAMMGMQHG